MRAKDKQGVRKDKFRTSFSMKGLFSHFIL